MSECKTGCGTSTDEDAILCETCWLEWMVSSEQRRFDAARGSAADVALVDFCNRVRAERQNTTSEGT